MAGNRETAMANLAKAWESPDIGKHGPSKSTLDKQRAREIYLDKLAEKFETIVDIHFEEAAKRENVIERKEVIHQSVGKPVEQLEVQQTTHLKIDV